MQTPFFPAWRLRLNPLKPVLQKVRSQPLPAIEQLFTSALPPESLATGFYGGSGNGCNGEVLDIEISAADDVYVGGDFTEAGGFPYSAHIGVFRASRGWNTTYIFTASNTVDSLSFDPTGVNLTVSGNHGGQVLNYVRFINGTPSITGNNAVFHTYFGSFNVNAFWTD